MRCNKVAIAVAALTLSTSANSAVLTFGNLTTDNTTNYITDTVTGRQYLRFDAFDLTYAQTIAAVEIGGTFEEWTIATSQIADDFFSAGAGTSTTPCDGPDSFQTYCGGLGGWQDGNFGQSTYDQQDAFWYISTEVTPGRAEQLLGYGYIAGTGAMYNADDWGGAIDADALNLSSGTPLNALLYRDISAVPVPAAVWLFGSGLIGLIGMAKRKKT